MKMRAGMQGYRPCIYQSPSGEKIELSYSGELSEQFQHRTSDFTFVGIDGAYIQDNGLTAREFPLELHISGYSKDKIDLARRIFQEKGIGILQYPEKSVGSMYVVPKDVKISHEPITGAGVTKIAVTFVETIKDLRDSLARASDITDVTQESEFFSTKFEKGFLFALAEFIADAYSATVDAVRGINGLIKDILGPIAQLQNDIYSAFQNIYGEIVSLADTIVLTPIQLFNQFKAIIQLPEQIFKSFKSKVKEYKRLIEETLGIADDGTSQFETAEPTDANKKRVVMAELTASIATISIAKMAASENYDNRKSAFQAADDLVALYTQLSNIFSKIEAQWSGVSFLDKYKSRYADLRPVIASAVRAIRSRAANLSIENIEIIEELEHPISTCARLYGNVDTITLQKFYRDNLITGDEMFGLEPGREVVWYL